MKYYFISYKWLDTRSLESVWEYESTVINNSHPVQWLIYQSQSDKAKIFFIVFWEEISEEIYKEWKNKEQSYIIYLERKIL